MVARDWYSGRDVSRPGRAFWTEVAISAWLEPEEAEPDMEAGGVAWESKHSPYNKSQHTYFKHVPQGLRHRPAEIGSFKDMLV
jgi:hypothetical protein